MPGPTVPPPPDYTQTDVPGGSTPAGTTDIWNLGNLYGMPVALGMTPGVTPVVPVARVGVGGIPREDAQATAPHIQMGTTQELLKQLKTLQVQGAAGSHPNNLSARESYEQIQLLLFQNGAYGATSLKDIRFGQWTDQTEKAIVGALRGYEQAIEGNDTPLTFHDYLSNNRDAGSVGGKSTLDPTAGDSSSGSQPPQISLTDPNQIRASAQQAAQQALGQGLSADQLDAFVNAFHASESGAQSSTDGSVTAPSLSSDALAFAEQSDPQHYANRQAQGYMNAFVNLFAPTQSQRANITPVPTI